MSTEHLLTFCRKDASAIISLTTKRISATLKHCNNRHIDIYIYLWMNIVPVLFFQVLQLYSSEISHKPVPNVETSLCVLDHATAKLNFRRPF